MEIDKRRQCKIFPCIVTDQFEALGTEIGIQIVVDDDQHEATAKKDVQKVRDLYFEFMKIFSRFDGESELSKSNQSVGIFNSASAHMLRIAELSLEYNKKTQGLFDPRILDVMEKMGYGDDFKTGIRKFKNGINKEIDFIDRSLNEDLKIEDSKVFFGVGMDFSGIAKGYITDKISEFLLGQGWKNFLVDSGGDMSVHGQDENEKKWTVDIEGIDKSKLIFDLSDCAIATSGIGKRKWEIEGRRMHHLVNPKNPENFLFDLKSVSVVANSTMEADVWAKTLFLMGREGAILYAKDNLLAAVILDSRGTAWISPKAKEFLH